MKNKLYTHDEATLIAGSLEEILEEYDICVPSAEDDEREEDNMIGLYGSTYSDFVDRIEDIVIDFAIRTSENKNSKEIYSDNWIEQYARSVMQTFEGLLVYNRITVPPKASGSFGIFGEDRKNAELYLDVTFRALREKAMRCDEIVTQVFSGNI